MAASFWFCCFALVAAAAAEGMPVRLRDFADETNIQLWTCDRSVGQKWVRENDTTIRLASDMKCLDISNYGTADGANVWLFSCHTSDKDPSHKNQEWSVNTNGTITSVLSGKCLEAADSGKTAGTNVQLWSCSGADNQKWKFDSLDGTIRGVESDLCLDAGSKATCQQKPWSGYPYCDTNLDPESRAKDLVGRMTVEEKVTQMVNDQNGVPRLGVPPFGHTECTHGTLNDGILLTTLFPQALSFARSFDRSLVHSIARAISDEVRAKHNTANEDGKYNYPFGLICWAPVLNVCRDPRWGRCQEGYGEDPYLQAEMGTQYVKGLQYGPDPKHIQAIATCKHFDVHGGPEDIPTSRFSFDAVVSYRDWVETFQPAFLACKEAGAMSYMCSYNAINGVPACANRELLGDLLRGQWNFTGFVVSDCGAIGNVATQHHFAQNLMEASEFCIKAGCDWNCGQTYRYLLVALEEGLVKEEMIDISVIRLMKAFISLGVLDPPDSVPYNKLNMSVVKDHESLNRQAALESLVLLENNGLLPLNISSYSSVALVGPCADNPDCYRGDYDPTPEYIVTPRAAFTNRSGLTVKYASGCSDVKCTTSSGFNEAMAAAQSSDLVLYVGGLSREIESEGRDRANITLPGLQGNLVSLLLGAKKPVVVVLTHGAPVVSPVYTAVDAVLSAGYTGQEAGNAVYDVLTGQYNPSGRTVVTWYANDTQLPPMTNYSMAGRTYRYMSSSSLPLYYFGYGLSYTEFSYMDLVVSPQQIKPCQSVQVKLTVQNIGSVSGDEVVQVYTSFLNSTVPVPNIKLVGFDRLTGLDPSTGVGVAITIGPSHMTVVRDYDSAMVLEPGQYTVYAGGSQPGDKKAPSNVLQGSFTVAGETTPLSSC